ncbi:MAG TPA: sugar phosphate nucleotidyltransferase [Thermoguttaceae bacterium]|nr:sugar phosphate nucleotidyltransferase [Thermoguttaceae bacterium]
MAQPSMDKAVILARGLGTRMQKSDDSAALDATQAAAADTGVKAMIPIGRPFLDYVISALADAGYRRVCLVVGPDHDSIRAYYRDDVKPERVSIDFAVQGEPKGTADAVAAAEAFARRDPFLVINSDDYYPVEALRRLREVTGSATALFERESMIAGSNIPGDRIQAFALGLTNGEGVLRRILEKPSREQLASIPRPHWLSMNCWRFMASIFEACRNIKPSPRGELELPDAVQYAMDELGETFRVVRVRAPVLDMTTRQDVAAVAEKLAGVEVRL